jgi:hypothetical protein
LYFPFVFGFFLLLCVEQPSPACLNRLSLCIRKSAPLLRHFLCHRQTTSTRARASSSRFSLLGKIKSSNRGDASGDGAAAGDAVGTESRKKRTSGGCDAGGGGNMPRTTRGRARSVRSISLALLRLRGRLASSMFYIVLQFRLGFLAAVRRTCCS